MFDILINQLLNIFHSNNNENFHPQNTSNHYLVCQKNIFHRIIQFQTYLSKLFSLTFILFLFNFLLLISIYFIILL